MSSPALSSVYENFYYTNYCGMAYERNAHWLGFFGDIATKIVARIAPNSSLDAGCAWGFLVESLRDRGVQAFGLDHSAYAIGQVRSDIQPYCAVGSITEPFPQRYDLITCIEVLEHLPVLDVERAVANLCAHTDDIIFSSTPYHYDDATHLNVRPPDYWAELFAYQGFFRDVDFDASFLSPWAVRYRRNSEPAARIVAAYERRLWHLEKDNQGQHQACLAQQQQLADQAKQIADLQEQIANPQRVAELLAEKDRVIAQLHGQLQDITQSAGWKLLQVLWKLRRRLLP